MLAMRRLDLSEFEHYDSTMSKGLKGQKSKLEERYPPLCKVGSVVRFLGFEVIRFYTFDLRD